MRNVTEKKNKLEIQTSALLLQNKLKPVKLYVRVARITQRQLKHAAQKLEDGILYELTFGLTIACKVLGPFAALLPAREHTVYTYRLTKLVLLPMSIGQIKRLLTTL